MGQFINKCLALLLNRLKIPPTTSCSLVTKQAVTRGLSTKWVVPTLLLAGASGSGSFAVVILRLPDIATAVVAVIDLGESIPCSLWEG